MLPTADETYLQQKGLNYSEHIDGGLLCVVINDYALPPGYDRHTTTLLLRLPGGYPDAQPDMFWCDPPIRLSATGNFPLAAEAMETYLGRQWQRFSRHLAAGMWKPGIDSLGTFLTLIGGELVRSARVP